MGWLFHVKIKQFLTDKEDYESIKKAMESIASALEKEPCFNGFRPTLKKFKSIKDDDDGNFVVISNRLLDRMYDYADANRIWIGGERVE